MSKKIHTPCAIAAAALALAGVASAPEALAASKAERVAEAASNKADALEAQLQAMQNEINSLRAAAAQPTCNNCEKVQELDQWMQQVKSAPVKVETKDNMVFFRGGYGHNNRKRGGTLDPSGDGLNNNGAIVGPITDQDAWYFGAGFDFSVNDDLFGLMDGTEVLAELLIDYRELGTRKANGLSYQEAAAVDLPTANTQTATVNQLSIAASPKIKFLKGSKFRPWIVPVGFELAVISPPSDAITVLNPGMQFGAGADYNVWKNIYVGADARWHQALGKVDGVDTNGVTAGGYIGLGF
ncbi:porin family protein [Methylomicrobium lacus]|uniref:porin family protein n=1 Tax=Methylomicrobium lacus TaxID=136992 RepID=UPI0035A8EFC9